MNAKTMLTATVIGLGMCLSAWAAPSANTYHAVTNDWYNGNFSNVLQLAEQRLSSNSNDVVGAYLKLSWDICFSDIPTLSNSVSRAIAISDAVTNAAFSNDFQRLRPAMLAFRDELLPQMTEEMRQADLPKASLPHKSIPENRWLRLLWEENIW